MRFEAILDGETVVLASIQNDFGTVEIAPVSLADANEVQLRIVTRTNANGEVVFFDDVRLIGVSNCIDSDSDGLCDDLDNCTDIAACNYTDPSATECLDLDACGVVEDLAPFWNAVVPTFP